MILQLDQSFYVPTYDNKYVQFRLMSDTFNTTPTNWQGVDNEPTAGSNNLVKSDGVIKTLTNNFGDYCEPTGILIGNWLISDEGTWSTASAYESKFFPAENLRELEITIQANNIGNAVIIVITSRILAVIS